MAVNAKIRPGTIVWIHPRDPISQNHLAVEHPAIVLTPQDEIDAGSDLFVVVCTTSFSYPLKSGWFEMPSQPGGHPLTGLHQACVAKATWTDVVPQSRIIRSGKRAKSSLVRQILQWLRDQQQNMSRKAERSDDPPTK